MNLISFDEECDRYIGIRRRYINAYCYRNSSTFKLVQLLSVRNVKEFDYLISENIYILLRKFAIIDCKT